MITSIDNLPTIEAFLYPLGTEEDPGLIPIPVGHDGLEIIFYLPDGNVFSVAKKDLATILDFPYKWVDG